MASFGVWETGDLGVILGEADCIRGDFGGAVGESNPLVEYGDVSTLPLCVATENGDVRTDAGELERRESVWEGVGSMRGDEGGKEEFPDTNEGGDWTRLGDGE